MTNGFGRSKLNRQQSPGRHLVPRLDRPSRRPAQPKAPSPQAPVFTSKYKIVNHLRRYGLVYLFLALVECLLLATILFL